MSTIIIACTIVAIIVILLAVVLATALLRQQKAAYNERILMQEAQGKKYEQDINILLQEKNNLLERTAHAESRNEMLEKNLHDFLLLQQVHQSTLGQIAELTAKLKFNREKLDNQQNEMLRTREQLRLEFGEMAQKILTDQTKVFTTSNEEKMKQILEPLRLNLTEFKQKVEETYDKESKERFSLTKEVSKLIEMSQMVSKEANNLTTALKGNTKMQGNWGEMILEGLLENSGLTKGREYFVQEFIKDKAGNIIKDENGKGLQPDVTIYYPDQRKIIIDSKVSLIAWDECIGCDDKENQALFMKEHLKSIRQHIDGLTRKNYPKYALALDYVLLFIPIEPAFLEAVKHDLNLWKYAYDKKILLVSPTNLFAVLKIIADLWKVDMQNKNAQLIAEKAGALYEKMYAFIENLEIIGKKLQDATDSYNDAFKQLSTGRGNMIARVVELKKMGADTKKQIPDRLSTEEL